MNPSPTQIEDGKLSPGLTQRVEKVFKGVFNSYNSSEEPGFYVPSRDEINESPNNYINNADNMGTYSDYREYLDERTINDLLKAVAPQQWRNRMPSDVSCTLFFRKNMDPNEWYFPWHIDVNTTVNGGSAPTSFVYLDKIGGLYDESHEIVQAIRSSGKTDTMKPGDLLIKVRPPETIKVIRPSKGKWVFFNAASHAHAVVPTTGNASRKAIMIAWNNPRGSLRNNRNTNLNNAQMALNNNNGENLEMWSSNSNMEY